MIYKEVLIAIGLFVVAFALEWTRYKYFSKKKKLKIENEKNSRVNAMFEKYKATNIQELVLEIKNEILYWDQYEPFYDGNLPEMYSKERDLLKKDLEWVLDNFDYVEQEVIY